MQLSTFTTKRINRKKKKKKKAENFFNQTGKRCCPAEAGFSAEQMDYQDGCPPVLALPRLPHHLVHLHATAQIDGGGGENWCRTDRAVHCQRSCASLPLVVGVGKREHKTGQHVLELMGCFTKSWWVYFALDCESPSWPPTASRLWLPAHSWCHRPTSKGKWGSLSPCWMMPCSCNARHRSSPWRRLSASPFCRSQSINWQPGKERWYATPCSSLSCRMEFLSPMRL